MERSPRYFRDLLDQEVRAEEQAKARLLVARNYLSSAKDDCVGVEPSAKRAIEHLTRAVELLIINAETDAAMARLKRGE